MTPATNLQGIIFDMDGTIVDNMHFHKRSWLHFLSTHSLHLSEEEFDAINHGTIDEIIKRLFGNDTSAAKVQQLGHEKEALYRNMYQPYVKEIEGFTLFLNKLKKKGFKVGLATMGNNDNINFTLDAIQVSSLFDAIAGGNDVVKGKPDPAIFLQSIEQLKVSAAVSFAFEDSFSGIEAAKAAGLKVIGITTAHTKDELLEQGCIAAIDNYNNFDYTILVQ